MIDNPFQPLNCRHAPTLPLSRVRTETETPAVLDHAVRLHLPSRLPALLLWGDARACFANDAFKRLTGMARGGAVTDALPELWPVIAADVGRVMRGGEATWHEEQRIPPSSSRPEMWWSYGVSPVEDAGAPSGVGGVLLSCMDVTRQHRARESLRAVEERTRFALAASESVGTWDWDIATDMVRTGGQFARFYGVDPRHAEAGAPIAEFTRNIHPDDQKRVGREIAEAVATGREFASEYRLVQADGSARWVAARGRCVHGEDGKPIRFPGVTMEVTERKNAEARGQVLLELDERFSTLDSPEALAFAAAEMLGRTLGVSRAGYGTIDTAAETITIDRDWNAPGISTIAGVLAFREYGSYIDDLKRGETVVVADAALDPRTAAGADALKAISACSFINMPVTEPQGLVALLYLNHAAPRDWPPEELAFVREVAQRTRMAVERRRAERDLRALAENLEAQVAERTHALMDAEAALRQSQKMEAVGQLTGGLAHDFNNLLTGITGSLEILQARVAQGRIYDVDRYVNAAQGAARRAASLTHRLLAFSRRQTLDPKPTDVNRLIAGMEEMIRRTVGPEIAVETVGSGGLWNTLVDPSQLENALLNLAINARDAMPDGGRLTIETSNRWLDTRGAHERDLPPGQYVSLCVSDTGVGMPADVVARAFDPFFTTKPIGEGTGLGLSMIYGFARQSGGQVRIYSEVGHGAMVCLYLPRHLGAAEIPELIPEPSGARRAGRDLTVLVVDDEPTVRMLVTEVLDDLGYQAIEAADGPSALKLLRSDIRIDLLVTDVGLPGGMNGRQLADAARVMRADLKVLFITGYAENAVLNHGHLEAGMQVLTKPFAMTVLAGRIDEMVAG